MPTNPNEPPLTISDALGDEISLTRTGSYIVLDCPAGEYNFTMRQAEELRNVLTEIINGN